MSPCSQTLTHTQAYCRSLPDRDDYENPHTLGYRFLAEARRLWDEDDTSRITSIQAALFLNFVYDMCTLDKVGLAFEERAVKMAEHLQLFKPLPEIRSRRQRSARTITAWALFNWQRQVAACCLGRVLVIARPY
jgi:hypothetical protein